MKNQNIKTPKHGKIITIHYEEALDEYLPRLKTLESHYCSGGKSIFRAAYVGGTYGRPKRANSLGPILDFLGNYTLEIKLV